MAEQDNIELEFSAAWGWGLLVCFFGAAAIMVAGTQGDQAIQALMYFSLIGVFLCCGVFVGLLAAQALGAYFRWGDLESNVKTNFQAGKQATPDDEEADQMVDPFYEILKRNSGQRKAA